MPSERFALVPASYVLLLRAGTRGSGGSGSGGSGSGGPGSGSGDEVLLQRRQHTGFMDGFWAASAAGHVERGESCTAAVVREAHEELGITVDAGDLTPLGAVHRTQDTDRPVDQRVDFFFACRRWSGEPELREPKASELGWFGLAALPDPVVPHERVVLEALAAGTVAPVGTFGF